MSREVLPPYPEGWYCVAFADELPPGAVLARRAFGREVVAFRGTSGGATVVDAHCPHLGAHLGHGGRVEGDTLRCPFHGFCFDARGACVSTPYGKRLPPLARARAWPLLERNGALFVWNSPAGRAPGWEVPEVDWQGFTPLRHRSFSITTHVQEAAENSVDLGHFAAVHGYLAVEPVAPVERSGAVLRTAYRARRSLAPQGMEGDVEFEFHIQVHGLGCSIVDVDVLTFGVTSRQLVLATPVDEARIELRVAAAMEALPDPGATDQLLGLLFAGFVADVEQDVPIWEHKRYLERPALAEGDGPIGAYRSWARQFYE